MRSSSETASSSPEAAVGRIGCRARRGLGRERRQRVVGVVEPDVAGVAGLGVEVLPRVVSRRTARTWRRVERDVVDPAVGRDHEVRRHVVRQRLHDDERGPPRAARRREVDREPLRVAGDDAEHGLALFELDDRRPERGAREHRLGVAEREDPHGRLAEHAGAAGPLVLADELAERLLHLPCRDDDGAAVEPVADGAADRELGRLDLARGAGEVHDGLGLWRIGRGLGRGGGREEEREGEREESHGRVG